MNFWDYLNRRSERLLANPVSSQWSDPRAMISFSLIGLFAYAYVTSPNALMTGALIGGFASGYGYWIGASKGGSEQRDMTNKALDVAAAATAQNGTTDDVQPVKVVNKTGDPVPTKEKR